MGLSGWEAYVPVADRLWDRSHEVASHKDVVDVAALQQELSPQHPLGHEAAPLVKAAGTDVVPQHPQRDLARPEAAALPHCLLDQAATDTRALLSRIDCQSANLPYMRVRRERRRGLHLDPPRDEAVQLRDEHVTRLRPVAKKR